MMRPALVAMVIAVPLAAQSSSFKTVLDTKGRYPVVRVTGEPPMWRLDSLATLADSDGVGFSRVYSVLVDPRGGVLVMATKPAAINRFDDHGKLLGVLGRIGAGPREYQRPAASGWIDGDLVVYDPDNGRLIRWNARGEWVAQWLAMRGCCAARMVYPAGPSHVWLLQFARPVNGTSQRIYVRYPATGHGDTVWVPERPKLTTSAGLECPWGTGSIELFSVPFAQPVYSVEPGADGNFVEMSGLDYRVAIRAPNGDTLRVLERTLPPVPITDRKWADSTAEYRNFMGKHSGVSCNRGMDRPATKAQAVTMEIDDRGRLWVEHVTLRGVQWDIWDHDRLVGTASGARNGGYLPIDIRGDRIAVTRRSDDGGQVVVVFRIVPH